MLLSGCYRVIGFRYFVVIELVNNSLGTCQRYPLVLRMILGSIQRGGILLMGYLFSIYYFTDLQFCGLKTMS